MFDCVPDCDHRPNDVTYPNSATLRLFRFRAWHGVRPWARVFYPYKDGPATKQELRDGIGYGKYVGGRWSMAAQNASWRREASRMRMLAYVRNFIYAADDELPARIADIEAFTPGFTSRPWEE